METENLLDGQTTDPLSSVTINTDTAIDVNISNSEIPVKILYSDTVIRDLAMTLYSYADFSKIQSNKDFARLCIQRAKDFYEVYSNYIKK